MLQLTEKELNLVNQVLLLQQDIIQFNQFLIDVSSKDIVQVTDVNYLLYAISQNTIDIKDLLNGDIEQNCRQFIEQFIQNYKEAYDNIDVDVLPYFIRINANHIFHKIHSVEFLDQINN